MFSHKQWLIQTHCIEKDQLRMKTLDTWLWAVYSRSLKSGYVTRFLTSFQVLTSRDPKSSLFSCDIYSMWVSFVVAMGAVRSESDPRCQTARVCVPGSVRH